MLRFISAHLRPQEPSSKPKVPQLRGQCPVIAAHNAVTFRQRRIHIQQRMTFPFIHLYLFFCVLFELQIFDMVSQSNNTKEMIQRERSKRPYYIEIKKLLPIY